MSAVKNKENLIEQKKSKIIDIEEVRRYKNEKNINAEQEYLVKFYQQVKKVAILVDTFQREKNDDEHIIELEKENERMKNKLKNSFPVHIMYYLIISSIIMSSSGLLLVLRFSFGLYVIDPYYVICALLISITLFATATVAIRDWKDYLDE